MWDEEPFVDVTKDIATFLLWLYVEGLKYNILTPT